MYVIYLSLSPLGHPERDAPSVTQIIMKSIIIQLNWKQNLACNEGY